VSNAWVRVTSESLNVGELLNRVHHTGAGAVTCFIGTVREVNDGRAVTGIDYEAYEPMASRELAALADEAVAQWPGCQIAIEHRIGTLRLGEASVVIAVSHARRAPALDAQRYCIETLKQRVPIWKREHYVDGDWSWVDPTSAVVTAP
jgi:molybdopterin synthase catalytic subunit